MKTVRTILFSVGLAILAIGCGGGGTVTVEGKEFADALFRNWLGGDPSDSDLKTAMLSGK